MMAKRGVMIIKPLNDVEKPTLQNSSIAEEVFGTSSFPIPTPINEVVIDKPYLNPSSIAEVIVDRPGKENGNKSCANMLGADKENPKSNFRSLFSEVQFEDSDCVLPVENVMLAQNRFANSLVGFFVG
ncbi:hypothetical protein Tco_1305470, partial [Tanacetum coccineum]